MDPKQIRASIVELYTNTVGKSVDAKTLSYLVSSVSKGENSIPNIAKTLVNTTEYAERARSMFSVVFYDAIGFTPDETVFDDFWSKVDKTNVINSNTMEAYIRSTQCFKDKYTSIIKTLYASHNKNNAEPSEDIITSYLERLMADTCLYDTNALENDIIEAAKVASSSDVVGIPIPQATNPNSTYNTESSQGKEITFVNLDLDESKLSAFEKEFSRPMFVKEYFKYVVHPSPTEITEIFGQLGHLKATHISNFNRLSQIYSSYTGTPLSEHKYINDHLMFVDEPSYFDLIIEKIVDTIEYRTMMETVLLSYYKKLYDIAMDDSDLHFIFEKVRSAKMHLHDEKIVEKLKDFKAETDMLIENIFVTYERVLERQPDTPEIEEHLSHYRIQIRLISIEQLNSELSIKLSKTLEFHDIVKKHIKTIYHDKVNETISPSKLYAILQAIITQPDITIDNLDERIMKHIIS